MGLAQCKCLEYFGLTRIGCLADAYRILKDLRNASYENCDVNKISKLEVDLSIIKLFADETSIDPYDKTHDVLVDKLKCTVVMLQACTDEFILKIRIKNRNVDKYQVDCDR